jgi:hypothetical protein
MRPYIFSPEHLTPEQRTREVARILAAGLLRLLCKAGDGRPGRAVAMRFRRRGLLRRLLPVAHVDDEHVPFLRCDPSWRESRACIPGCRR